MAENTGLLSSDVSAGDDATAAQYNNLRADAKKMRQEEMTAGETIDGATLPVPVYQDTSDNEVYACDANVTTKLNFFGFAITNAVDAGAIIVQHTGIVGGFTGLDEGEKYYVQDAVGTIGKTPGTTRILAGIAISATELLILKSSMYAYVTATPSRATINGGTNALLGTITCGFRPKRIYGYAYITGSGSGEAEFECDGNANQQCHHTGAGVNQDPNEIINGRIVTFYAFNGDMYGKIQNITKTGFDIQIYNTGNVESGNITSTLRFWIDGE